MESPDAVARLYLLGQFTLERRDDHEHQGKSDAHKNTGWQSVTAGALQQQSVRALLICLISSPGRKLGREQAIEVLWPGLDYEVASHRLDKAVHSLRQVFQPGRSRSAASDVLLTEYSALQLADQSRVWIDADAFDALLTQARSSSDPGETEQLLEDALLLYGGEYAPDARSQAGAQARRESLQRSLIGLLLELADLRIAREDGLAAIDILDRLLVIDPVNEAAVQRLILSLAQVGRRGEALRIYQRFTTLLKQEYRMSPLPETRALYEAARRGNDSATIDESRAGGGADGPPVNAPADMISPSSYAARVGEEAARAHMHIGRSKQSSLVGREQELTTLQQMLLSTEQSRQVKLAGQKKSLAPPDTRRAPQCLLLVGDVGIGKTRLAEELGRAARQRGWTVAWARAYAQETHIPYSLWTESLRRAMSQGLWQRQEIAHRPAIYQALRALLPELEELLPQTERADTSPEQEQLRLWEATHALFDIISESAPLLIVLDDLQWADKSSCELLAYLARHLRGHPILIVSTCRDIELPPLHPLRTMLNDLQRERTIETIPVQPLSDAQIRTLVSGLPEPVVGYIQSRAAGNPFFAEELARNINLPDLPTTMPDTITAVLDLRLGRISSACRRMLVSMAIVGGSFEFNLLRAMENVGASFDEEALLDLLEEALQAGMITEEGGGTRITYHFWHPLLVSHLYNGLSAGRRASLHRRAAEALRAAHTGHEEEVAAAITYHLLNGGASGRDIAHYAELAGDRAYALSAYPEAEKQYRVAIEQWTTLPAPADLDEYLHRATILERAGESTRIQGKPQEARQYHQRALEERHQRFRFPTQFDARYEAQIDALLWVEIGKTWLHTGDIAQAQQCYSDAERALQDVQMVNGFASASVHLQMSYVLWQESHYEQALQSAHQSLRIFEQALQQHESDAPLPPSRSTTTRRTLAGDPVERGRAHLLIGTIAAVIGDNTDALKHLNAALALYEQYDRQREIAIVCCNLGDYYLRKSEYALAQSALRRSSGIAEHIGDIPIMIVDYINLGIITAHFGDLPAATALFKRALASAEEINDPVNISVICGYLSPVALYQGNITEATSLLCRAIKVGRAIQFAPSLGVAYIALGSLYIARATAGDANAFWPEGPYSSLRLLQKARKRLLAALSLDGLEAEARTEGQLALAQVSFLLGEIDVAQQQAEQAIDEAGRFDQAWLLACGQRLMGSIHSAQGQYKSADACFAQALDTLRQRGMRLEEARTLRSCGESLMQRAGLEAYRETYAEGLRYLQEARDLFEACHAVLDLEILEQLLKTHTTPAL